MELIVRLLCLVLWDYPEKTADVLLGRHLSP